MARNEVFRDADHLSLPVPADTVAGKPIRVGGLNVVTETDRADSTATPSDVTGPKFNTNPDGNASCFLKGAHTFPVAFAVTAVGQPIYIVIATNALTDTANSGANPLYGHALTTKTAPLGDLVVRIAN